ncbi:unnamed protein product [Heligmosomoides polygyrus]|uniref:KH_dom_type_1 domain-containing protein n=1 Tax=Heligmosomoides polygyrus TaxID=6339 RepID=A0A183G1N5_HELPZ|nr:unnamed protein product [Heligmosomoides polygyrus]
MVRINDGVTQSLLGCATHLHISRSKCNFIGRIIGPAGMSVKQLESDTGCHILIRGRGSVKVQQRLRGQPGWDHLEEPLHVLVTAVDHNHFDKLLSSLQEIPIVRHLLTPAHDDYKRCQLMQLAIINGTYQGTRHFRIQLDSFKSIWTPFQVRLTSLKSN